MDPSDHEPHLSRQYMCYQHVYSTMLKTKSLLCKLLIDYELCVKCVFKMYNFEFPKIYSDVGLYLEILPKLIPDGETLMTRFNVVQCGLTSYCWVCESIFQKSYINATVDEIIELINQKGHISARQFKLNVRVPNIISLKQAFLAQYIYQELKAAGIDAHELKLIYNVMIVPFETNRSLDAKVILKWLLSNELNNRTNMTSTSEDSDLNLTISIDQNYSGHAVETSIMRCFSGILSLEFKKIKKSHKKVHIDQSARVQGMDFKCTSANSNKILQLKHHEFQQVLQQITSKKQFLSIITGSAADSDCLGQLKLSSCINHQIALHTCNLYICGKYIKYSRYLSQTPWVVNGKKLTEGSMQEEIEDKIIPLFYPSKQKVQIQVKFHSGGREDIDVRMLKGGRPFVLEFVNPIKSISEVTEEEALSLFEESEREEMVTRVNEYMKGVLAQEIDKKKIHSLRITKILELLVNNKNQYVQIRQFQQTKESYISVQLKAAESEKIKHYICYIYSRQSLTQQDKMELESLKLITIKQQTPIRVMHRRSLMLRHKQVYRLNLHLVSQHSAVLEVWACAGTYIKEFVHGDLGRTMPNIGSLLRKDVDILQLDVGSLKEGQWKEGDDETMKIVRMEWMD